MTTILWADSLAWIHTYTERGGVVDVWASVWCWTVTSRSTSATSCSSHSRQCTVRRCNTFMCMFVVSFCRPSVMSTNSLMNVLISIRSNSNSSLHHSFPVFRIDINIRHQTMIQTDNITAKWINCQLHYWGLSMDIWWCKIAFYHPNGTFIYVAHWLTGTPSTYCCVTFVIIGRKRWNFAES